MGDEDYAQDDVGCDIGGDAAHVKKLRRDVSLKSLSVLCHVCPRCTGFAAHLLVERPPRGPAHSDVLEHPHSRADDARQCKWAKMAKTHIVLTPD